MSRKSKQRRVIVTIEIQSDAPLHQIKSIIKQNLQWEFETNNDGFDDNFKVIQIQGNVIRDEDVSR